MIERVLNSMFHWYRLVGGASEGARALELDGVQATLVPAAAERSVMNSVLYRSPAALESAYDEVAAAYREIGAKWTVWVPPGDDEAARILERRGHVLDADPMAMGRGLDGVKRPRSDALADWTAAGDLADLARVNDRAYTFDTDSFGRSVQSLPDGAVHVYIAREAGEPVAGLAMGDHAGNSELDLVAVVPEARGRGLAAILLGHALADAAERGNETTTLIATRLGYPVYERAGYEPLGRFSMWERAAA